MSALYFLGTFLVIGLLAYYADAKKGVGWYRGWYKMTHKEPLPAKFSRGFIVGRKAIERIWPAVSLAAIATGLLFLGGEHNFLKLFWLTGVEAVALFFGFFLAGFVHTKFNPEAKAARILETLDGVESGKIDPAKEAREAFASTRDQVVNKAKGVYTDLRAAAKGDDVQVVPEAGQATTVSTAPVVITEEVPSEAPQPVKKPTLEELLERHRSM